jgi:hypothetical protein
MGGFSIGHEIGLGPKGVSGQQLSAFSGGTKVSFVGVEQSTLGNQYAVQNWSLSSVQKAFALSIYNNKYGTSGYYQIRPIPTPSSETIFESVGANDLGVTSSPYPTQFARPWFRSSGTGYAGSFVNFTPYPLFLGADGSTVYRQGALSVAVNNGPYNTPSGDNTGYFGEAFGFVSSSNIVFRLGVAVDTVADSQYAPDYVGIYSPSTGTVFSSLLTREAQSKMAVFDITALSGDAFSCALWQLSGTNSFAAFSLITTDIIP